MAFVQEEREDEVKQKRPKKKFKEEQLVTRWDIWRGAADLNKALLNLCHEFKK